MERTRIVYILTNTNMYKQQEYKELLKACDLEMVECFRQDVKTIDFRTYIGSGKVIEIADFVINEDIHRVYFNVDLSPLQVRNLEEAFQVPVIDREELILEIFQHRAVSNVAKLQIELAQLKKVLPRLIGSNTQLSRQSGGKNKGTGEKQLELDRRRIKARINELQKNLKSIEKERITQRKQREKGQLPLIALVGYTNAGKSTLLNTLLQLSNQKIEKQVLQKDMLFATLDTTVRRIAIENHHSFLLSDTVGFVSDLPHNLIEAFKSTLEEIKHASLLVQVVDASDRNADMHIKTTNQVLHELFVESIPMITVYNKCDLSEFTYPIVHGNQIHVSLQEGAGIVELLELIEHELYGSVEISQLFIPYNKGKLVTTIIDTFPIESIVHDENGTRIYLYFNAKQRSQYQSFLVSDVNS